MDSGNILWRMRNEICPFFPNFQKSPHFINSYSIATMSNGCEGYFTLCILTDGWKKVNIMELFSNTYIFCETLQKVVSKMPYTWENPMKLASLRPLVTVAKTKVSFATMTHGCKGYFSLCNRDWRLQRGLFHGIFALHLWKSVDFWK